MPKNKIDIILAETFPEKDIGFAIMHRLKKASQSCYKYLNQRMT